MFIRWGSYDPNTVKVGVMIDLIGHVLNKADYNDEEKVLALTVDGDKVFLIKVEGECCSEGKFLGATSAYSLDLPSKIVDLKERNESFDVNYGEYTVYEEIYVLENGKELKIVYDNMSNGYYGSSLGAYYNGKKMWGFPKEKQP